MKTRYPTAIKNIYNIEHTGKKSDIKVMCFKSILEKETEKINRIYSSSLCDN